MGAILQASDNTARGSICVCFLRPPFVVGFKGKPKGQPPFWWSPLKKPTNIHPRHYLPTSGPYGCQGPLQHLVDKAVSFLVPGSVRRNHVPWYTIIPWWVSCKQWPLWPSMRPAGLTQAWPIRPNLDPRILSTGVSQTRDPPKRLVALWFPSQCQPNGVYHFWETP